MSSAGIARRPAARPEKEAPDRTAIFAVLLVVVLAAASFAAAYDVGRIKHRGTGRVESPPTVFHVAAADSSIPTSLGASPAINVTVPAPPKPAEHEHAKTTGIPVLSTSTGTSSGTSSGTTAPETTGATTEAEAPQSSTGTSTPPSSSSGTSSGGSSSSGGGGAGFDSSG
jgi:uncharacterized membrane protein YgcG